ncbi:MAG: ATP-binding protein [Planctomycetota bacterium JB042]
MSRHHDAVEQELRALRAENERLRDELRSAASANVRAAEQIVESSLRRQRKLEEQNEAIREALNVAEEASRQKTMFVANISHELRTPLNGILGMASLLLERAGDAEAREHLSMLLRSGENLLEIVNDLLDLAKIDVEGVELDEEPFDPWRTAEAVVQLLAAGNHDPELEIAITIDPSVPRSVVGDGPRLRQVLLNLAGNAMKFTDRGRVDLALAVEVDRLAFVVRDTGCGIDADALERLFEPFVQADGGSTRAHGGTGLGLAISRRLVEGMGGEIEVRSEVGVGSEFRFRLPLRPGGRPRPLVPVAFDGAWIDVEDERSARIVRSHLAAVGLPVAGPGDGPSALPPGRRLLVVDRAGRPGSAESRPGEGALEDRVIVLAERDDATRAAWRGITPDVRFLRRPLLPTALLDACGDTTERPEPRTEGFVASVGDGLRVLLAEDNPINARVAVAYLRGLGCAVDEATDGRAAVRAFESGDYDVIFMDCQMPEMDGYEAAERIRALEGGDAEPVTIVALTAHAMADDRARCLRSGMDDYLTKPTRRDDLAAVLARRRRPRLAPS